MSRHRAADEPDEVPVEEPGEEPGEEQPAPPRPRPGPGPGPGPAVVPERPLWQRPRVLLAAGVLLTVVAIVAAVVAIRRDDSPAAARTTTSPAATGAGLTSPALAQSFVAGAVADITAVTAYDYRSLDVALTSGLAVTTGAYREAYRSAITGDLGTTARAQRIVQTFEQSAAGIGAMSANGKSAKVLIFGIQSVVRGSSAPVTTPVTLTASMAKVSDRYLISKLDAGTNAGLPPGTTQLSIAAETARSATVASLTLRRSTLASDYAAALAGTVDPRRSDLVAALAGARTAVQDGKYDLTGRVTAIAVERVVDRAVAVLIGATGVRVENGKSTVVNDARLRVTVVRTTAGWRVTDSQPVNG